MVIAAGWIPVLANNIEHDDGKEKDMLMMSLESFNSLLDIEEFNKYDLSISLIRQGVLDRIVLVFDYLQTLTEPPYNDLFMKALSLVRTISTVNSTRIKDALWSSNIVKTYFSYLNKLNILPDPTASTIVITLKNIFHVKKTMDTLINYGIIETLVYVYEVCLESNRRYIQDLQSWARGDEIRRFIKLNDSLQEEILKQLLSYCQYSLLACEECIQNEFLKLSLKTNNSNDSLLYIITEIFIWFINMSENIRNHLWEVIKGPFVFLTRLGKNQKLNSKVLEALISWFRIETYKMEDFFWEDQNLWSILKHCFPSSKALNLQEYKDILPLIKELIGNSHQISLKFCKDEGIIKSFERQLLYILNSDMINNEFDMNDQSTKTGSNMYSQHSSNKGSHGSQYSINSHNEKSSMWAMREILEILILAIDNAKLSRKNFVDHYQFSGVVSKIYHFSKKSNLLEIKELTKKLKNSN